MLLVQGIMLVYMWAVVGTGVWSIERSVLRWHDLTDLFVQFSWKCPPRMIRICGYSTRSVLSAMHAFGVVSVVLW